MLDRRDDQPGPHATATSATTRRSRAASSTAARSSRASTRASYFFADYAQNWIKRLTFDADGNVTAVRNFEPAERQPRRPVRRHRRARRGPGRLALVRRRRPVRDRQRGRRSGGSATSTPTSRRSRAAAVDRPRGPAPLTRVSSPAPARSTPRASRSTYSWDFGDGDDLDRRPTRPTPTRRRPLHRAADGLRRHASSASSDPLTITVGSPPAAAILTPSQRRGRSAPASTIAFSGSATDPDDGALPGSALTWKVVFHHDGHIHPFLDAAGAVRQLTIPTSGHSFQGDTNFELVLTATDRDGIQTSTSITLAAREGAAERSRPPPPGSRFDRSTGSARPRPSRYDELVGFRRSVGRAVAAGPRRQPLHVRRLVATAARSRTRSRSRPAVSTLTAHVRAGQHGARPGWWRPTRSTRATARRSPTPRARATTGTLSGPVWAGAGRNGGALQFDGVNDIVRIDDHADLDLTTAMTLEAWVRPSALGTAWRTVLFKEQTAHMTYALYANTGDRRSRPGRPTSAARRTRAAPRRSPTNAWTHLAHDLRRRHAAALRQRHPGASRSPSTGAMTVSTGQLKLGGNGDLGRVVRGPDGRRPRLQPRTERNRDRG